MSMSHNNMKRGKTVESVEYISYKLEVRLIQASNVFLVILNALPIHKSMTQIKTEYFVLKPVFSLHFKISLKYKSNTTLRRYKIFQARI